MTGLKPGHGGCRPLLKVAAGSSIIGRKPMANILWPINDDDDYE